MAPEKVFPTADGRPDAYVLPAANPEASRLTNPRPPATVAAPEVPQAEGQGAWAWASDELKQKLRRVFRAEANAGEPSSARKFGAGFGFGAIGLGDKLGLHPHREIEKLRARVDELESRRGVKRGRGSMQGGTAATERKRSPKEADIKLASRRLRQLQKDVANEVKAATNDVSEEEIRRELYEQVFCRSFEQLAVILNDRYDYPLAGAKTISRTSDYKSWAPHRQRGNARRLDGDSPAVADTAKGGESSRSGRSRDKQFADAHSLRPARFGKLHGFDKEAQRKIAEDPKSRRWLEENGAALEEPRSEEAAVDNP